MPGPFHGLSTMSSALMALQRSIDVTGNNIANVNTKGYSRQRVDLRTAPEITFHANGLHHLGSGVSIASISRARNMLVDRNASGSFSEQGRLGTLAKGLEGIDSVSGEPGDQGITTSLGRMFNAWSALAANPSGSAQRIEVRSAAIALSDRIQTAHGDLLQIEQDLRAQAGDDFARVDQLTKQIADLNRQITSAGRDGSPNALLDERQRALDELSGLVKIEAFEQGNGAITVQAAGEVLVDQGSQWSLPQDLNPASSTFNPARAALLRSGSILGGHQAIEAAQAQRGRLDDLANEIRSSFNSLHSTGVLEDGTPAGDFFDSAGVGAAGLKLSQAILDDPKKIASGTSGKSGDGSLAQSLSNLRNEARAALGGASLTSWTADMVNRAASDAYGAAQELEGESLVGQQIEAMRQAESGVSLDEEFSQMVQLQRSYQAAARALRVFDEITEDLLGMIR